MTLLHKLLAPFFSSDGSLLAEPVAALSALQREMSTLNELLHKQIRVSRHIEPWLKQRLYHQERRLARTAFLSDVEQGKRSMDIVNVPLYQY